MRRLRPLECQKPAQGHTTASRKPGAGTQLRLTSKPLSQCHRAFPRGGLPWGFPVTTHTGEGRPQTTQHSLRPSLPFSASCVESGAQWRQAPCPTPGQRVTLSRRHPFVAPRGMKPLHHGDISPRYFPSWGLAPTQSLSADAPLTKIRRPHRRTLSAGHPPALLTSPRGSHFRGSTRAPFGSWRWRATLSSSALLSPVSPRVAKRKLHFQRSPSPLSVPGLLPKA